MQKFLRYVVEETIAGRQDGLKEYSLGLAVFHRPPDYDPRTDAIVRVQASQLRKRLSSYYDHEGRDSTLRISLPRGGYVPVWSEAEPEPLPSLAVPAVVSPPRRSPIRRSLFWAGIAAGAVIATAAFLFAIWLQKRPPAYASALWGPFVTPKAETIVSFGVPVFYSGGGFFIRDTAANTPNQLTGERYDRVVQAVGAPVFPQQDVYTGIGDMLGTYAVGHWLEAHGVRITLANSHNIGHADIAGKNLVVVSSVRFQTLLQEMKLPSRFTFVPQISGFAVQNPGPGEPGQYTEMSGAGVDTSYALIRLWPGKPAGYRILYVSGINTWATLGAAQYALNPEKNAGLQRRLNADPPNGPKGRKSPFFEVLLRIEGRNCQVRTADYVTHGYLPQGAVSAQ
ncbi:MAG: hypothetical protein ABFD86_22790 [Bryobacteraceae bacterium]